LPALSLARELVRHLPVLRDEIVVAATFTILCLVYAALFALMSLLFGRGLRRQLL
jgi:hypothetical protein